MYERKEKRKYHVYMPYQIWNRILGRSMISDISGGIRLAERHALQVSNKYNNIHAIYKKSYVENLF